MAAPAPRPWRNVVLSDNSGQLIGVAGNPLVVTATLVPGTDPIPVTNSESLNDGDPNTAQPVLIGAEAQSDPDDVPQAAAGDIVRVFADRWRILYAALAGVDGGGGTSVVAIDPVSSLTSEGRVGVMVHDPPLGLTTDAAVTTDAAGSVNAHVRGLVARAASTALGLITRVVDSAGNEILGLTTSAAVITDANGSLAGWLRGLVTLTDAQRMIAPSSGDCAENDVTSGAAVSFTTVAGRKYWISVLQDMNFIDGSAPTSTTGAIIPAGAMVGPIEAASTSFQFIARGTTGRVSVAQVNP